ncbi:MAG TPA: ribonuclease III domain-containing protein [Planktothrix sp.]|jgi:ribonuclease-3 family protein
MTKKENVRKISEISPRLLAHLGDAVFHLFEREREIMTASSVKEAHRRARVDASAQADLLDAINDQLTEAELEIVRRARNVKPASSHRSDQGVYRKATAFEALLGYLHLTDRERLQTILHLTMPTSGGDSDVEGEDGAGHNP